MVVGIAKETDFNGMDVTSAFLKGLKEALQRAEESGLEFAILKAHSLSCISRMTYDGSFSRSSIEGQGVTAALFEKAGIQVFNEDELDQVANLVG